MKRTIFEKLTVINMSEHFVIILEIAFCNYLRLCVKVLYHQITCELGST